MSKTKRHGHAARISALERDLRRLRAQLPREIHHAVRHELQVERMQFGEETAALLRKKIHAFGSDSYSTEASS